MESSNFRESNSQPDTMSWPPKELRFALSDAPPLAQTIVDSVRDPLLVLDQDLRVVTANRAFHQTFRMSSADIVGRPVYGLGDGQWDIPEFHQLLEGVAAHHAVVETCEVERDFPAIGRRSMLLNAREVFNQTNSRKLILLAIEDVTERRAAEREIAALLEQKETLLQEMQHRIANSLQIIAGILLLKAGTVESAETRLHLRDAHDRVMSVATVQQELQASGGGGPIEIGSYLTRLCDALAASMIGNSRPITVRVKADAGTALSGEAVSLGLIITELVINALKHAFPGDGGGEIVVRYETDEVNWRLSVSDNGGGLQENSRGDRRSGLGTSIVEALALQLKSSVEIAAGTPGMTVSIVHAEKKGTRLRTTNSFSATHLG